MKTMRNQAKHILRAGLAVILVLSMLVSASVMCFAEETDTSTETVVKVGIKDMDVSLGEDIMVRFYTDSTTDDGSKLVVAFDGKEYEITQSQYVENKGNAFMFIGVTPQKLGDEMTATLYGADGVQIGETKTVSVKSYLEGLLALSYEDSGLSQLKYQAMRELCVNMLNYGAAAQTYVDYKTDNLVNKDLSDELKALATEKITVTDTDKAVNGDAWVGAGVRFDYKLGLYFVFRATSAGEYTATVNGEDADIEAYEALGEGYYVIRYNSFNATNMNDVVTAKLTDANNAEQTFAYSIRSYVASKGNTESAVANLVNATYTYGYAAVAYSAEYITVDPTFEKEGSISMDAKGYDFGNTKYGTVTLPKLNFDDYTAETVNSGTAADPEVTTTFTLNSDKVAYTKVFETDNCIALNGALYSQYDVENSNVENVAVTYDATDGYTYDVADGKTAYPTSHVISYGANLVITGNVEVNYDNLIDSEKEKTFIYTDVDVTVGTSIKPAVMTLNGCSIGMKLENSTLHVYEGSTLTVNDTGEYSIYLGKAGGNAFSNVDPSRLIVDGTVNCAHKTRDTYYNSLDENAEYGFIPNIYVRKGTLTTGGLLTYSLLVGSEAEDCSGKLILTAHGNNAAIQTPNNDKTNANLRWVFAKGTVETAGSVSSFAYAQIKQSSVIDIRKGMTFNLTQSGYNIYHGYSSTTNARYLYVEKGATYNVTNANEMIQIYKGAGHMYFWDELTVTVDGVEKTVRVVNYTTGTSGTKITADQCNATIIEANTAITSSATTQGMGTLGEFTQGKYIDANGAEKTVWYQIVD